MNILFIFLAIWSLVLSGTCPNLCSGHGSCTKSGTCVCYKGYTYGDCSGKVCPYGKTYVEPTADKGNFGIDSTTNKLSDVHTDLECSGKGNCNRESGLCECFEGFEGSACQRLSCPNSCSSHGLCVPVKHLTLNANSDGSAQYEKNYEYAKVKTTTAGATGEYNTYRYDGEQSYACVCDGDYTGYDCSEKKCPSGYSATSDCEETSSKSIQIFTDLTIGESSAEDGSNDGSDSKAFKCLAYLEYTDMLGRKWYSDRFCTYCEKYDSSANNACSQAGVLGWNEALHRLPVGVIDPDTTAKCVSATANKPCQTVEITFGNQQTGRQNPLKLITNTDLTTTPTKELYPGGTTSSGYHGMSTTDLPSNTETSIDSQAKIGTLYYVSIAALNNGKDKALISGVKPSQCAGNGYCNTETGLCECFTGFYGIACTMTEDMM